MLEVKSNLVFTSAGKHSNIEQWLSGQSFDIFVVYYADGEFPLRHKVQHLAYRKGGKFQNLHYFFQSLKHIFDQYSDVFVVDDDIEISGKDIDRLFEYRRVVDASILQPSFSHAGKISHSITGMQAFSKYRFTNFVEVTCPLFSAPYLFDFLNQFDSRANGGGVDFWFCQKANELKLKIVIVDEIWCTNPQDTKKQGIREIDKFQSREVRNAAWSTVKHERGLNLNEKVFQTYSKVRQFKPRQIAHYLAQRMVRFFIRVKNNLMSLFGL